MPAPHSAPIMKALMALMVGLMLGAGALRAEVTFTREIKAAQSLCKSINPQWLNAVIAAEDPNFLDRPRAASIITVNAADLLLQQAFPSETVSKRQSRKIATTLGLANQGKHADIICLLLQHAAFGHGTRGHDTAARRYFLKGANQLSLAQTATLAGFLEAPSQLSRNHMRARDRRNAVLREMAKLGMIDESTLSASLAEPLSLPR